MSTGPVDENVQGFAQDADEFGRFDGFTYDFPPAPPEPSQALLPQQSYCTITDGDAYFSLRIPYDVWVNASTDDKTRALAMATQLIDHLNYQGIKHDPTQVLEFPRNDDTIVPRDIQVACCEIAYALLDGRDLDYDTEGLADNDISFERIRVRFDKTSIPVHIAHQIPSVIAWNHLRPYLRDAANITLSRSS